jgi:Dynein heavy chain, N-terminal region 2
MDEELKRLKVYYDFYKIMNNKIENWSKEAWSKLDYQGLDKDRKEFKQKENELAKRFGSTDTVFVKLQKKIKDYVESLPLIKKLKDNHYFKA